MNAFTGGCHLSYGCDKYAERCGACPQLGSSDPDDLSRQIWRRKREAFKQIDPDRLQIVTTSRWMAEQVTRSSLLGSFTVTIVPNSLDSDDFAPRNRSFARDTLGIPREARVVLFVAVSIAKRHKGFALLVQALAGLVDQSNLLLVSVGGGKPALDIPLPHLHLGYIENERLLSLVYSAADVFVMPSRQESFGQTAIEALACGIPVVGFAIGGIPDIVRPGVTGLLVPAGDVAALRSAIAQLLQDQTLRDEMSANCRRIAVEEYTLEVQARRYLELYETLLAPN
jgi:glycosyltransferase involved in cell wall biosynthesis